MGFKGSVSKLQRHCEEAKKGPQKGLRKDCERVCCGTMSRLQKHCEKWTDAKELWQKDLEGISKKGLTKKGLLQGAGMCGLGRGCKVQDHEWTTKRL